MYLGARVNSMLLVVYKKLGLRKSKPIPLRLLMAGCTMKRLVGTLCNVLVKLESYIFPTEFIIINYKVDIQVPITLGRLFLTTGTALIDMVLR